MYPSPPIALLIAGLLMSLACGTAFQATLRQIAKAWPQKSDTGIGQPDRLAILTPFLGITVGASLFLTAGLGLFGFSLKGAALMGVPLSGLTACLVWWQLNKILLRLEQGDLKALNLDWLE